MLNVKLLSTTQLNYTNVTSHNEFTMSLLDEIKTTSLKYI